MKFNRYISKLHANNNHEQKKNELQNVKSSHESTFGSIDFNYIQLFFSRFNNVIYV